MHDITHASTIAVCTGSDDLDQLHQYSSQCSSSTDIRMTADTPSKVRLCDQPLMCVQLLQLKRHDVEILTKFYLWNCHKI